MWRLPDRLPSVMVALLAVALLTSCVVPVPVVETGYPRGSRGNLGEAVPEFIASGKTTLEEVLLSLGQADAVANDGSWLLYRCSRRTGGMIVFLYPSPVFPAFKEFEHRRLVVYFDEGGVVERTQFDKATCRSVDWAGRGAEYAGKWQCFDSAGNELSPSSDKFPLQNPDKFPLKNPRIE